MIPKRQAQIEGRSIKIRCTGRIVQWLKDDTPLYQYQYGIDLRQPHLLIIQYCKLIHTGSYTCLSQDEDGNDQMGVSQLFIGGQSKFSA